MVGNVMRLADNLGGLLFKSQLMELQIQFYSMTISAQSKARLMTLFIFFWGFVHNSGFAQSPGSGGQTDPRAGQAAPSQTTDKNAQDVKALEALNKFLSVARQRAEEYNTLFRDLATEEKRSSIPFKRSGEEDERREVICEFVVYQSRIEPNLAFEYRSAKSVDGKLVSGQEKRVMKLFENLTKAKTPLEERELINKESFNYDKVGFVFYGTVIFQWRELMEFASNSVVIEYAGSEKIDGEETVVLNFQQTSRNERLEWLTPPGFKGLGQRVRGKLWLDARTAQIRRAERELRLIMPTAPDPVTLWKQTFDYAKSDLGILVPKRFVYDQFFDFRQKIDGVVESFQTGRLISEFGTFQRFAVTSSEQEKKTIIKDKPQPTDKKTEI
jgi:hypothetical protein